MIFIEYLQNPLYSMEHFLQRKFNLKLVEKSRELSQ